MFTILDGVRKIYCNPFVTGDNVFNKMQGDKYVHQYIQGKKI